MSKAELIIASAVTVSTTLSVLAFLIGCQVGWNRGKTARNFWVSKKGMLYSLGGMPKNYLKNVKRAFETHPKKMRSYALTYGCAGYNEICLELKKIIKQKS